MTTDEITALFNVSVGLAITRQFGSSFVHMAQMAATSGPGVLENLKASEGTTVVQPRDLNNGAQGRGREGLNGL